MKEEINTDKDYKEEEYNERYNINNTNSSHPIRLDRSYDNTINRKTKNINFTSYNITSENNNRKLNLEKYTNIRQLNQSSQSSLGYLCGYQCGSQLCPYMNHCYLHNIHFYHMHIPHNHFCPRLNNSVTQRKVRSQQLNSDLLNEVAELRKDCRKFREELEKTKNENEVGNKYIQLLEKQINIKEKKDININVKRPYIEVDEDENEEEDAKRKAGTKLENKYHDMLNKSFEVLNSVSNKCDDEKGKVKGGANYYVNKDPDYDELIEAQKKWLDNLPEKFNISRKNDTFKNLLMKIQMIIIFILLKIKIIIMINIIII